MSGPGNSRFTPDWLALRQDADATARSTRLLAPLRAHLAAVPRSTERLVIWDLGCGIGSLGRWLAGRLPGPQHWVLYDRDPELLAQAGANMPGTAADGGRVTVETRAGDLTGLRAADFAGVSLVTASALLDLLTFAQVSALAAAIVEARCPALFALSVVGRVELTPADPLDAAFAAAFNAHQRHGARLGPDAVTAAAEAFERHGAVVHRSPSPWLLGPDRAALLGQWLSGWVAAAGEQRR